MDIKKFGNREEEVTALIRKKKEIHGKKDLLKLLKEEKRADVKIGEEVENGPVEQEASLEGQRKNLHEAKLEPEKKLHDVEAANMVVE